jgi:hypothetical protein
MKRPAVAFKKASLEREGDRQLYCRAKGEKVLDTRYFEESAPVLGELGTTSRVHHANTKEEREK